MKPETKTMIEVGTWLERNGYNVYFNSKNDHGFDIFHTEGTLRKPDMIFREGKDEECFVVEIKPGEHGKSMRDSHKIVDYYKDVIDGNIKYSIFNKQLKPLCFLVATEYSKEGHLIKNEKPYCTTNKEASILQGRPQIEYCQTYNFSRMLWQLWKPYKNKEYKLGVLLSDKLNGGTGKPAIFIQNYNLFKNRWFAHRFYVNPSMEYI